MAQVKSNNKYDTWFVYRAQQLNDGFSNIGRVKKFTTHDDVQDWIRKQGDTNKTYLVEHLVGNDRKRDQPQNGIKYVEQWTAFTGCLCAHTEHGPFSPWVRYDFHNDEEFQNRGHHPNRKHQRTPELKDDFGSIFRTVPKPTSTIKEAWDLCLGNDFHWDKIKSFSTHDEMEKWIRTNGDTQKTYRAQHIVNDKLQQYDEDWTIQYNLHMPFIEQWQYFEDCRHGWVRYDFRVRDEFDMAMDFGRYGKGMHRLNRGDSTESKREWSHIDELRKIHDCIPPKSKPILNEWGFDEEEEKEILRRQKWEVYGRSIAYNSGPPDLNQLDGNNPSAHNQTKLESLCGIDPKWAHLINNKERYNMTDLCSIPSPKSNGDEKHSSTEIKESVPTSPKPKPKIKVKPTIAKWKTATGYPLTVENDLTGQLGERDIKDGWELCTDRYDQVLVSQTRDEQKTWLTANGRRGHVYNSKHIVDGQSMPCDAGYWHFTDDVFYLNGIFSTKDWKFTSTWKQENPINVKDRWELYDDMHKQVHVAPTRDGLEKWLRHRGNRHQTYRSRHVVDGKNQIKRGICNGRPKNYRYRQSGSGVCSWGYATRRGE